MGFVTQFFIKPAKPALVELPHGSFMIDRNGRIMTSTLPGTFPPGHIYDITERILAALRAAERTEMALSELVIDFTTIRLVARYMRNGALVFVEPQAMISEGANSLQRTGP
ncbi:MAG: hypothetical protein L0Y58_10955 [Verrucomicrobia subdivision 3 bacterium]|nr:hypothetical protein [Limisphaerales bacterium]